MQPSREHLVLFLKAVDALVTLSNILEKLCVVGFSLKELRYHFANICNSSSRFNCLESFINGLGFLHFLVHLSPHENVPQFLHVETITHVLLGGVLVFIGSCLGNILITLLPLNTTLDRLLFVFNAFLEFNNTVLSVLLLLFDVFHKLVEDILALKFFLLS